MFEKIAEMFKEMINTISTFFASFFAKKVNDAVTVASTKVDSDIDPMETITSTPLKTNTKKRHPTAPLKKVVKRSKFQPKKVQETPIYGSWAMTDDEPIDFTQPLFIDHGL